MYPFLIAPFFPLKQMFKVLILVHLPFMLFFHPPHWSFLYICICHLLFIYFPIHCNLAFASFTLTKTLLSKVPNSFFTVRSRSIFKVLLLALSRSLPAFNTIDIFKISPAGFWFSGSLLSACYFPDLLPSFIFCYS